MAENKTVETDASVTEFLDGVENETRRRDGFALLELMREVSGVEPKMWGPSIVGFGRYHYRYDSGRDGDWMRIGFSPRKGNLALHLMFGSDETKRFLARLGKHKTGVSCLYVNKLADVDVEVLRELVSAHWRNAIERHGPP